MDAPTIDDITARIEGTAPVVGGRAPKRKPTVDLIEGDCREILRELDANSVDAVVTDPPYGLEFMGKDWDSADGFRRALNPNDTSRDNAFGRTSAKAPEYRTSGRGQKSKPGIGDRPTEWVSNQGWNQFRCANCGHLFHGGSACECADPRPVKADNRWNVFQEWCTTWAAECLRVLKPGGHLLAFGGSRTYHRLASAVEDAGFEIRDQIMWIYGSGFPKSSNQDGDWEGWGTALKPAHEPIVVARKPLIGTMAKNLARHGVGALNIDGCRVGNEERTYDLKGGENLNRLAREGGADSEDARGLGAYGIGAKQVSVGTTTVVGRWPANIIHDGSDEVLDAFPQARGQIADESRSAPSAKTSRVYGAMKRQGEPSQDDPNEGAVGFKMKPGARRLDSGSAARFFYCAKASKADRGEGNVHPTVKPTKLMRYLCRLVTPPGGTVLDPFMGSGSTGRGAVLEGFNFIGIEMDTAYYDIADQRIAAAEREVMK